MFQIKMPRIPAHPRRKGHPLLTRIATRNRDLGSDLLLTAGGRLDSVSVEADESIANTDLYYTYYGTRTTSVRHTLPGGKLRLAWARPGGFELAGTLGHTARVGEANELFIALRRKGHDWVGYPELEPARNTGLDVTASWEHGTMGIRWRKLWLTSYPSSICTSRGGEYSGPTSTCASITVHAV